MGSLSSFTICTGFGFKPRLIGTQLETSREEKHRYAGDDPFFRTSRMRRPHESWDLIDPTDRLIRSLESRARLVSTSR